MSIDWVARQLLVTDRRRVVLHEPGRRYNPLPPGAIMAGSSTEAVLAFLREQPKRFFNHREIVFGVQRTGKAVDWALACLRYQKLIECVPDTTRNSRYLRYRIRTNVKE